jgi:4-diphosphocytidyl-2-C-methyl-D-erythritol kinase
LSALSDPLCRGGEDLLAEDAPAKVNLFLHVTGKREDGYHLLDSLVVFAGVGDRITYTPSDTLTLSITGPFARSLACQPDNLVSRAARVLAGECGIRPTGALTLDKQIPVASGIGGGSADCAATLRLLRRAWRLNSSDETLHRLARGLGADVPVCLRGHPTRMRGTGEILRSAPLLPECGLVLVNPGVELSTASVFRGRAATDYSADAELPQGWSTAYGMAATLFELTNDLESAAISLAPAIRDVSRAIASQKGCLLSRMSGSGATCYGLFASVQEAEEAARDLTRTGWWSWGGALSS